MKRYFLTLAAVCLAIGAMAVDLPKQGFGIQVGFSQPILRLNSPDTSLPKDSMANTRNLNGFKVGLVYDASYIAGFGSTIGFNYTFGMSQGSWKNYSQLNQYPRSRSLITYHQAELFVDWQYKFEIAKETYLILYTGPTLQCGIEFKMREDVQREDIPTGEIHKETGEWNSAYQTDKSNEQIRRLNITWGVGAGFQYKRYFLRGGYDFGLINPYKNAQFIDAAGNSLDRNTRGRMDQWNIRLGVYMWYHE
jgi:hypothetical protein